MVEPVDPSTSSGTGTAVSTGSTSEACSARHAVGVGTAHLTVLEQWLGNGGHHLARLSERVDDHELVDAV